jgi:hypothetical protein
MHKNRNIGVHKNTNLEVYKNRNIGVHMNQNIEWHKNKNIGVHKYTIKIQECTRAEI